MLYDALTEAGPFERFWDLRREFDRLFDQALPASGRGPRNEFIPDLDADEDDEGLTLHLEVPGVAPDGLSVSVNGHTLSIEGERSVKRDENTKLHRSERVFGKFSRSVHLPDNYDLDAIEAKHENGVLTLRVPRSEAAKPRTIRIEAH